MTPSRDIMRSARKGFGQNSRKGFTLVEVMISLSIMALLAASVYAIVTSVIGASRTAMDQQLTLRRLDAFLRVTRGAFLNLPPAGTITLEIGRGRDGQAEQQLILAKAQRLFGLPSLGGGSLVLASQAQSDGTRSINLLRISPNATDQERAKSLASPGIPLLPGLRKPHWTFRIPGQDDWQEELPAGSPRPLLVRLQLQIDDLPNPVEAIFYVPPLAAVVPTLISAPAGSTPPSPAPTQ